MLTSCRESDPVKSGELTLLKYWEQCFKAGEVACPLAAKASSPEELNEKFFDLLAELRAEPLVLGSNITTDVVQKIEVTGIFNNGLRIGIAYGPLLAGYLNAIFDKNNTAYQEYKALVGLGNALEATNVDAVLGIRCSDAEYRTNNLEDIRPRVEAQLEASPLFGEIYATSYAACAQWPFLAKGRYEGDYVAKTETPALIIGSPYDVRTPLSAAQNVSASLVDSVVLQHNGLGVSSRFSPCQLNHLLTVDSIA